MKTDFMQKHLNAILCLFAFLLAGNVSGQSAWVRINQLGYNESGIKTAVLVSLVQQSIKEFELLSVSDSNVVFKGKASQDFGTYGPFKSGYRLDFSAFKRPGRYVIKTKVCRSPSFEIRNGVYDGTADFCLRYMRQQRSEYNPFLKDSCHTNDGFTVYAPVPDGTFIDVAGGWHDASDYLQYASTSANATFLMLAAYRDFQNVFTDKHLANGLEGGNGTVDILDEANWGLRWLVKMHPRPDWMFNQLGDDRDHVGFRLPTRDSANYGMGKGRGRPAYFLTGEIQGLGKYKNRATGTASTGAKFASAFALAAKVLSNDSSQANFYRAKALTAFAFANRKHGASQTASVLAPYIYEEDNWIDDMELATALLSELTKQTKYYREAQRYSDLENTTPWMGADTARHYQWYPFMNFGHYELAKQSSNKDRRKLIGYYRQAIDQIGKRGKNNAFLRGVPFIWCSNNLTAAFAIQCILYRKLSGDNSYREIEQSAVDWLFGCNPWGTSMVYGLPKDGDTPADPHSSFTVLHNYPLDGGLVDGPVSGHIFKKLLGLRLAQPDEYATFQSDLGVYHDDIGDYSTNEPTMDGTAYMIYLLAALEHEGKEK